MARRAKSFVHNSVALQLRISKIAEIDKKRPKDIKQIQDILNREIHVNTNSKKR